MATICAFLFSACSGEKRRPLDQGLYTWKEKARHFEGYSPEANYSERILEQQTTLEDLNQGPEKPIEQEKPLPTTPVSIKVTNVPAGVIIATLARKENINILNTEKITGNISLNLKRVPWNQIFTTVLRDRRCTYEWEGNVLRVLTPEDIKQEAELAEMLLKKKGEEKKLEAFSPVETKIVKIQFANVKEVQKTLQETLQQKTLLAAASLDPTKSKEHPEAVPGSVILDQHTNSLILRGQKSDVDLMVRLIKAIDIPTSQINIKAYIVETTQETGRDLGLQWGGRWRSQPWGHGNRSGITSGPDLRAPFGREDLATRNFGPEDAATRNLPFIREFMSGLPKNAEGGVDVDKLGASDRSFYESLQSDILQQLAKEKVYPAGNGAGGSSDPGILNSLANAIPGAAGARGLGAAGLGLGLLIGNLSDNFLDIQLAALEEANKANILSNPSITTIDNVMAYTENGEKIPYVTVEDGEKKVKFEDAVLRLEITPHVVDKRYLKMDIKIRKDEVDMSRSVQGNPLIIKKETQTSLIVENNETIVISGLTKTAKGRATHGVPGLKDAPLLGWLFKGQSSQEKMHDVLIFITPKILPRKSDVTSAKLSTLEKLEKLTPTHDVKALKWKQKSEKFLAQKYWDEVIRAASIALTLDPGLGSVYCDRARAYLEKELFQKSYDDSLTALYMNKNNSQTYRLQGLALEGMGQQKKALESLEKGCGLGDEQACKEHRRLYYKK